MTELVCVWCGRPGYASRHNGRLIVGHLDQRVKHPFELEPPRPVDPELCVCGRGIELIAPPGLPSWWAHIGAPANHLARRA